MKNYIIFGIVAVVVVAAAVMYYPGAPAPATATADSQPTADATQTVTQPVELSGTVVTNPKPTTMSDGLIIEDTKIGNGAEAKKGSLVRVNYVGTFADGKKFDASADHGTEGFTFPLGQGRVIKGWDEGVVGMKVGGTRKLTVPPQLGYGENDYGPIPGNSTLLFTVELLAVRDK